MIDVDCASIHRLLRQGRKLSSLRAEAHLDSCAPCRALVSSTELTQALDALGDCSKGPSVDALLEGLSSKLTKERGPRAWLRSPSTALRALLGVALLWIISMGSLVLIPRPDVGIYPVIRMVAVLGLMTAAAIWALTESLRPLHRPAASAVKTWAAVLAGPVIVGLLSALPAAHLSHPASLAGQGADLLPAALACFLFGALLALPVLAFGWLGERRSQWLLPQALLIGTVAALAGNIALQLHCPVTSPEHLLLGHATVSLAVPLIVVGSLSARRFFSR